MSHWTSFVVFSVVVGMPTIYQAMTVIGIREPSTSARTTDDTGSVSNALSNSEHSIVVNAINGLDNSAAIHAGGDLKQPEHSGSTIPSTLLSTATSEPRICRYLRLVCGVASIWALGCFLHNMRRTQNCGHYLVGLMALLVVSGSASASLVIHNVGDSQSFNNVHRQRFQDDLLNNGIAHTWVGDVTTVIPSNSYGGASLFDIHNGRVFDRGFGPLLEPGLLQTIPRFDPDVIMIFGGINNLIGDSATETMAEMTSMLDYIESTGDRIVLVSNVPAVVGTFQIRNPEIEAYNIALRNEISNRQSNGVRIALADNFSAISTSTDLNSDGVHLNSIGQQKVGDNWLPAYQQATAVPEPSQYLAIGACLLGICMWKKLATVITQTEQC